MSYITSRFFSNSYGQTYTSTSTGITLYNTADQTTNYERARLLWASNQLQCLIDRGGTGTLRDFYMSAGGSSFQVGITGAYIRDLSAVNSLFTWSLTNCTAASGLQSGLLVNLTTLQSGTAGYRALELTVTEGTTGSGEKSLIMGSVGGLVKFRVFSSGLIETGYSTMIRSSSGFTNGAGAAAGTLANAPVAGNPTKWIPIDDNGTTRYIPAW